MNGRALHVAKIDSSDRFGTGYFTAEVSASMRIARVMCITMMMFVHIWPGATRILSAEVPATLHVIYVILINEFGRASVPLLSIVSGLLYFRSVVGSTWQDIVLGKVRTLLVPMAAWSAVLLALYTAHAAMVGDQDFFEVPALTWINRIFAITAPPINLPLAFLRDIFVCCIIGLFATRLEWWLPWAGRALLVFLLLTEFYSGGYLLLRPSILFFFGLGYVIALYNPRSLIVPWTIVLPVVAIDILIQFGPVEPAGTGKIVAELFHRTAVALLMWRVALTVVRRNGWLRHRVEAVEPLIFLVFCSHMIAILVMSVLFNALGLGVTDAVYPVVFAMQIPAVFGAAVAIRAVGDAYFPKVLATMTGRKPTRFPASSDVRAELRQDPEVKSPAA